MPLIQDYNKLFEHTDNIKKVILNGNVVWPTEKPASGPDYTEPFYVENITNENETLSIVKSDDDAMAAATKKLGYRLMLAGLLFFIPTVVQVLLGIFGITSDPTCGIQ